jgi:hypothetical protein
MAFVTTSYKQAGREKNRLKSQHMNHLKKNLCWLMTGKLINAIDYYQAIIDW